LEPLDVRQCLVEDVRLVDQLAHEGEAYHLTGPGGA
jgi:hypothetical protein